MWSWRMLQLTVLLGIGHNFSARQSAISILSSAAKPNPYELIQVSIDSKESYTQGELLRFEIQIDITDEVPKGFSIPSSVQFVIKVKPTQRGIYFCQIPMDNVAIGKQNQTLPIVEVPTDDTHFRLDDHYKKLGWTELSHWAVLRVKNRRMEYEFAKFEFDIKYTRPISMRLALYADQFLVGDAADRLGQTALKHFNRSQTLALKVIGPFYEILSHSSQMSMQRVSKWKINASLCPFAEGATEIDTAAFGSLLARSDCDIDLTGDTTTISPEILPPAECIQATVNVTTDDGYRYIFRRYFEVRDIFEGSVQVNHGMRTYADRFMWRSGVDLHINLMSLSILLNDPSAGFTKNYFIKKIVTNDCLWDNKVCNFLKGRTSRGRIVIPGNLTDNRGTDVMVSFHHTEEPSAYRFPFNIFVRFRIGGLSLNIRCVRNCGQELWGNYPTVWYAECPECDHKDPTTLRFEWANTTQSEGGDSRYLTIAQPHDSFTRDLTVYVYKVNMLKDGELKNDSATATKSIPRMYEDIKVTLHVVVSKFEDLQKLATFRVSIRVHEKLVSTSPNVKVGPVHLFFHTVDDHKKDTEPWDVLDFCSFSFDMNRLALSHTMHKRKVYVGMGLPSGQRYGKNFTLRNYTGYDIRHEDLKTWCSDVVEEKQFFGLSGILALAQDVRAGNYTDLEIKECFSVVKNALRNLWRSEKSYLHKNAYRILHTFFMAIQELNDYDEYNDAITKMANFKQGIFNAILKDKDLVDFTRYHLHALVRGFETLDHLDLSQRTTTSVEQKILHRVDLTGNALMELYVIRHQFVTFKYPKDVVHTMWVDAWNLSSTGLLLEHNFESLILSIFISPEVFQSSQRKMLTRMPDTFLNIVVFMSERTMSKGTGLSPNCGFISLRTRSKTTKKSLSLRPRRTAPIEIRFQKKDIGSARQVKIKVTTNGSAVIDSSCVIFSLRRSPDLITVDMDMTSAYVYEYAAIPAEDDFSKLMNTFTTIDGSSFRYTLTPIPKGQYKEGYVFFVLKISSMSSPEQLSSKNDTTSTASVNITMGHSMCYYMKKGHWKVDYRCKPDYSAKASGARELICRCSVHASYSALVFPEMDRLELIKLDKVTYNVNNMLPSFVVGMWLVLFVYYSYWAVQRDRLERDNYETHVIKDGYCPASPEQFLVGVNTGGIPGSGTNGRVSFLLVGEVGSHEVVKAEGDFSFSAGSEVWFMVSSDMMMGDIVGVTVNLDKTTKGQKLTPWNLAKVIVYSRRLNNLVILHCKGTLGPHLPSIVLPTVVDKHGLTRELSARYWRLLRSFHVLASVLFHRPGYGPSKFLSGLFSLTSVMLAASLATEAYGPPYPINRMVAERDVGGRVAPYSSTVLISLLTGCISLLFRFCLFNVYYKRPGLVWYDRTSKQESTIDQPHSRPLSDKSSVSEPKSESGVSSKSKSKRGSASAVFKTKSKSTSTSEKSTIFSQQKFVDKIKICDHELKRDKIGSFRLSHGSGPIVYRTKYGSREMLVSRDRAGSHVVNFNTNMMDDATTEKALDIDGNILTRQTRRQECYSENRVPDVTDVMLQRIHHLTIKSTSLQCQIASFEAQTHSLRSHYLIRKILSSNKFDPSLAIKAFSKDRGLNTLRTHRHSKTIFTAAHYSQPSLTKYKPTFSLPTSSPHEVQQYYHRKFVGDETHCLTHSHVGNTKKSNSSCAIHGGTVVAAKGLQPWRRSHPSVNLKTKPGKSRSCEDLAQCGIYDIPRSATVRRPRHETETLAGAEACSNVDSDTNVHISTGLSIYEQTDGATSKMDFSANASTYIGLGVDETARHGDAKSDLSSAIVQFLLLKSSSEKSFEDKTMTLDPEEEEEEVEQIDYFNPTRSMPRKIKRRMSRNLVNVVGFKANLRFIVMALVVQVLIVCAVWPCINGFFYRVDQSMSWLLLFLLILLLQSLVMEPIILAVLALVSMILCSKSLAIRDCEERLADTKTEIDYRESMIPFVGRHMTFSTHHQAAQGSTALFNLHNIVYYAIKRKREIPKLAFHTDVYWLLIYTVCILAMANVQSDTTNAFRQDSFLYKTMGLPHNRTHMKVNETWRFLEKNLYPALQALHPTSMGGSPDHGTEEMLVTPVRLRQLRLNPLEKGRLCLDVPRLKSLLFERCNPKFSYETMDSRDFDNSWKVLVEDEIEDFNTGFLFSSHVTSIIRPDNLRNEGYEMIFSVINPNFKDLIDKRWIDENTRIITVEFSVLNSETSIVSCFKIRFDFTRVAPFMSVLSYEFYSEAVAHPSFVLQGFGILFLIVSVHNVLKESVMLYKIGFKNYTLRLTSYIELLKFYLSILLCYAFLKKQSLTVNLLQELSYVYSSPSVIDTFYIDFMEVALYDRIFAIDAGFMSVLCVLQLMKMTSRIRRLMVFTQLLTKVLLLVTFPVIVAVCFACFGCLAFGLSSNKYENPVASFMTVIQDFIGPQKTFMALIGVAPFMGSIFYLIMGFTINFFIINFFIAFLNEAYSAIKVQVRLARYRMREKTSMEYVIEFFGIQSFIPSDGIKDENNPEEAARDRKLMEEIRRMHTA